MKPTEALEKAIDWAFLSSHPRKPGVVIQKLPKDVREALEKLTSDDALNMRHDK